jgi:uncharacterized protein
MASENVEIVRRGHEAFNRGDLDAVIELYADDAEFRDRINAPDQPTLVKGREAIRQVAEQWIAEFDELRQDADEYTEAGDAVICSVRWHGRGKASGISIDLRQFDVYEIIEGQCVRATLGCRTMDEALEAAAEGNVERILFCYDAFARGDYEAVLELIDPEFEIVQPPEVPGAKTFRGRQGWLEAVDAWAGQFDDFEMEVERVVGRGDVVVTQVHQRARGRESGAPVEIRVAFVHRARNGKGIRWEQFLTWDEAIEAAGLSGQDV